MVNAKRKPEPLAVFGSTLAEIRRSLGWSQEQLALETGIARSYLSGVERGRRNISLVNIVRLAKALKIPVASLVKGLD